MSSDSRSPINIVGNNIFRRLSPGRHCWLEYKKKPSKVVAVQQVDVRNDLGDKIAVDMLCFEICPFDDI